MIDASETSVYCSWTSKKEGLHAVILQHEAPFMHVSLSIPFSSRETASLVQEVLNVDKELKNSGIHRTITYVDDTLHITFQGTDVKKLRVAVNSIFRNILLIIKTVKQFEN